MIQENGLKNDLQNRRICRNVPEGRPPRQELRETNLRGERENDP